MKHHTLTRLVNRLALSLPARERESYERLQVRLARVLSRLWEVFAELLDSHAALTSGANSPRPVDLEKFRPGDTLRLGPSLIRTDSRLVLADRLRLTGWQDLMGELADAVLHAPELARQEIATALADVDASLLRELEDRLGPIEGDTDGFPGQHELCDRIRAEEADTDEFPAQPRRQDA